MPTYLHVLHSKRLRQRLAAKLIWCYMAPMLDESDPRAIKVRVTGEALGMHRRTVRNAIRLLLGMGFLDCAKPPNRGAPGLYRIGKAASRSQQTRGKLADSGAVSSDR